MSIARHTLQILEFPKVLEQLARSTAFSASRELALNLIPSTDPAAVVRDLDLTAEARWLLEERSDTTIGGARDVRPAAGRARLGGVLDAQALTEVGATLSSMRRLRTTLLRLSPERAPLLQELAYALPELPALEQAIAQTIGEDGQVLDSASPKLARLRAESRVAYQRVQDRLQSIVSGNTYSEALQEPIVTVRNGRYVVPVKASHRRVLRGLVHDQSGSGQTLYIEPLVIVELNNKWRALLAEEEEEVARILAELSGLVGAKGAEIAAGVDSLALLDLTLAKAKYANALRCVRPLIAGEPVPAGNAPAPDGALVSLIAARHPLLDQTSVVPTDLWLGGAFRLLLITGPNTGGKTVALKTTGLLALMAQSGLHVPAAAPAYLPVFGQIFADIGDEQSIEQSLSTFSSHMTNIIRILRALASTSSATASTSSATASTSSATASTSSANGNVPEASAAPEQPLAEPVEANASAAPATNGSAAPALVLLDELGAGTDPVEGAALARAIVERLLALGVLGVATTHYAELKAFAYSTPGVENGSVEFDVETLRPTYKLTIGIPGRSNALAIASRLGLAQDLVERARATMRREDVQVEDLLGSIRRELTEAEAERARADALRADAEKYRDRLADELRDFERQRAAEWQSAREEIEEELREARGLVRRLRDDFRSVSLSRQWLEEADQRLQTAREQLPSAPKPPRRAVPEPARPAAAPDAPRPIQVGETVLVRSVGLQGEVLSIDDAEQTAEVQVGGFRMTASLAELRRPEKAEKSKTRPAAPARSVSAPPPPDVAMSIDLRGWRASEVADRLDRYLNDAYLASLPSVRVIHGKGTGALRQVVRDVVGGHPLVMGYEGGGQDGGEGVTLVRLIQR